MRWEIYLSVRRHVNQIQVLQLQQASHNGQMANIKRMRKFAIMAVYVCLVLLVCYLPNGFTLFVTALSGSNTGINHVQHYTLTLELLHSSLNPLIYCWKMKHVRHTVTDWHTTKCIEIVKAPLKVKTLSEVQLSYVCAWPSIHCLYFIYARKICELTHVKITLPWKYTFTALGKVQTG